MSENALQDRERNWLKANGVAEAQLQDMWYEFLTGRGYTGALDDMKKEYWDAGGVRF